MTKNRWIAAGAALLVVAALLSLALVSGDDAEPAGRAASPSVDTGTGDPDDDTTTTTTTTSVTTTSTTSVTSASTTTTSTTTTSEAPRTGPPPSSAPPPSIPPDCRETTTANASVRVCLGRAVAGQPVTFTVEASGRLRDDCGSPIPDFGDGTDMAVCAIGCESLPPEPVRFERTYEHTYAKGGVYTARFRFPGCGEDSGRDLLVAPLEVHVEGAPS